MKEIWEVWHPQGQTLNRSYILSVTNDHERFIVMLSNEKTKKDDVVKIDFYKGVNSYTILQGPMVKSLKNSLIKQYGEPFLNESSFFKIRNSRYIEWASIQSFTMVSLPHTQHFCIFTPNKIVHALAGSEPRIEFLSKNEIP